MRALVPGAGRQWTWAVRVTGRGQRACSSRLTPRLLNLQPDRAEGGQWAGKGRGAPRESGRQARGQRLRAEGRPAPSSRCTLLCGERVEGPASPLCVPLVVRMVGSGRRAHNLNVSSLTPAAHPGRDGVRRVVEQRAPRDVPPTKQERVGLSHPPARQPARELLPRVVGALRGAPGSRLGTLLEETLSVSPGRNPPLVCSRAQCGCRRGEVSPSSLWGARGRRAQSLRGAAPHAARSPCVGASRGAVLR